MNGFSAQENMAGSRSTRERLVANGEASVSRLPALRAVFQEAMSRFARGVQDITGDAVDIAVEEVGAARIGNMREIDELCGRAAIYRSEELRARLAVVASFDFAYAFIDVLFSSKISESFSRADRTLTAVEARAADFAMNALAEAFGAALSRVAPANFAFESVDQAIDWGSLGRKDSIVVVGRFRLRTHGRGSDILVFLPRTALDPFREALSRNLDAKGASQNPGWTSKLQDQVVKTKVTVSAVMEKDGLTLGDVARFNVGQVITLPISPTSLVPLKCGDRRLFQCALGQKDGHYTVRIDEFIDDRKEFFENILGLGGA